MIVLLVRQSTVYYYYCLPARVSDRNGLVTRRTERDQDVVL
jgi:hypothetical protein